MTEESSAKCSAKEKPQLVFMERGGECRFVLDRFLSRWTCRNGRRGIHTDFRSGERAGGVRERGSRFGISDKTAVRREANQIVWPGPGDVPDGARPGELFVWDRSETEFLACADLSEGA